MLPNVIFKYLQGGLGGVNPTVDSVAGLVVRNTYTTAGTIRCYHNMDEVEKEIHKDDDGEVTFLPWDEMNDFFRATGGKGELWVMYVSAETTITDICDKEKDLAKRLLIESGGRICFWGVTDGYTQATPINGIIQDIYTAIPKAEELRKHMAFQYYTPTRVILPGSKFDGDVSKLRHLHSMSADGVSVTMHGRSKREPDGTVLDDNGSLARVGFILGLLASLPVHRNIGRVLNGPLNVHDGCLTDGETRSEDLFASQELLHEKGYIFPIVRPRRAGYFYNDDPTATELASDYASIANGRVIDKVQRIAYDVYIDRINDDYQLSPEGKIGADELKNLQGDITDAVNAVMTSNGELSGFECYVDPDQDPIAAGKTVVRLRAQPRGYHKVIEVELGLTKTLNQ